MLDAKNQLSRLVKAALAGEEVVIASHGQPQVRLVPCIDPPGLRNPGALRSHLGLEAAQVDQAFSESVDATVRDALQGLNP